MHFPIRIVLKNLVEYLYFQLYFFVFSHVIINVFVILNKSFYIITINDHQCDLFFEDLLELNDIVYSNQKKNKIK